MLLMTALFIRRTFAQLCCGKEGETNLMPYGLSKSMSGDDLDQGIDSELESLIFLYASVTLFA